MSGLLTGFVTAFVGLLAPVGSIAPESLETLSRIVVAMIAGLFGLASTALAVLLRHYLEKGKNRKNDR